MQASVSIYNAVQLLLPVVAVVKYLTLFYYKVDISEKQYEYMQ